MATLAASVQPNPAFESPAGGAHFLSAPGREPVRAVGERFPAHPGVFGAPGATPSARGGAVPTAAPASNQKIVYTRPSSARLSKTNGLDLLQAGDAVFLHRDPPFLTHRQQKQVQAASLPRMNALLAGAGGALDINDAATRARIKAARVAHYQSELDWAEDAHLRFLTTHGRSQAVPDAGLRAELTDEENGLVVSVAIARGALARARRVHGVCEHDVCTTREHVVCMART